MGVHFDSNLDFEHAEFRKFLSDLGDWTDQQEKYFFEQNIPEGYTKVHVKRFENDRQVVPGIREVDFIQTEVWKLYEEGNRLVGVHNFLVPKNRQIRVFSRWQLYVREGLTELQKDQLTSVANSLKAPSTDQSDEDIEQYIFNEVSSEVKLDDYILVNESFVERKSPIAESNNMPNQRDAVMHMYGEKTVWYKSKGVINAGGGDSDEACNTHDATEGGADDACITLEDWSKIRKARWVFQHAEAYLENGGETTGGIETWVDDLSNLKPEDIKNIATKIIGKVIPKTCGVMKTHTEKLVTLFKFPEFRVVWVPKRIKVGCARVTISTPKLEWRWTDVVCYAFYRIPVNTVSFIVRICATCAVKAGLISGVVGVVAGNPGAAAAAFKPAFKTCIREDITDCVYPGISVIKERGKWSS